MNNSKILFVSGFSAGIILFYFQLKQEYNAEVECIGKYHEKSEKLNALLTIIRFMDRLCGHCDKTTDDLALHRHDSKLVATGETIRQAIDDDNTTPNFNELLEMCSGSMGEDGEKTAGIVEEDVDPREDSAEPLHATAFKPQWYEKTQSQPDFTKTRNLLNPTTKLKQLREFKSAPALNQKHFHKFAEEHLRMPSTVFITPYPLHMVYRKLRTSKRADLGYCHSVILSDNFVSNFNRVQNISKSEKYGSEMDWPSIYKSDSNQESKLSSEFQIIISELLGKVTDNIWKEHFYSSPLIAFYDTRYVKDLPEYRIFIQPLFYSPNLCIIRFLDEYYKIVSK